MFFKIFIKKEAIISISLLLCICIATFTLVNTKEAVEASAKISERRQVILDAGHGGFDGGAVASDGTVEKNINLSICLSLSDLLEAYGYKVIVTRQNDVSTDDVESDKIAVRKKSDLKNRLGLMRDYPDAIFVSIHLNKFTTSAARGAQVFYSGNDKKSDILSDSIQKSIKELLQPENMRQTKQATSSTYLMYNATIPAVLVECGFLSNGQELKLLNDKTYQKKMAFSIFCGINDYFENKGV